jgi:hypothetical protein
MDVDDEATRCPHCGGRTSDEAGNVVGAIVFGFLIAIVVVIWLSASKG